MKAFFLFLAVISIPVFGQKANLEPGVYTSIGDGTEVLKFILTDNKQFHLSFMSGTYEQVNDSVYFNAEYSDVPRFSLEFIKNNAPVNSIKVDLGESYFYSWSSIYIGLQKDVASAVVYKPIKDYLTGFNELDYEKKKLFFDIGAASFVYFIDENVYAESHVEKYAVPAGVSQIKLMYNPLKPNKFKLKGVYDNGTKELFVTEGATPILFSKNPPQPNVIEKPIDVKREKNWSYNGKAPAPPSYSFDAVADSTAVNETVSKNDFVFKTKVENSLQAALNAVKKDSDKFLVVFYDLNSTAKKTFDEAIIKYQNLVQSYMYNQYRPEYDLAVFYLATQKDKSILKKMGVDTSETVVILNTFGSKLYHYKGTIAEQLDYYTMSSLLNELREINVLAQVDQVVKTTNVPTITWRKSLLYAQKYGKRNYGLTDVVAPAVMAPVNGQYVELEVSKDTLQKPIENYEDYSLLREKNNVYKLRTTPSEYDQWFKKRLELQIKEINVNTDFLKIVINHLASSDNFNFIVFGTKVNTPNSNDFLAIDYILRYYKEIPKLTTTEYEYQFQADYLREIILDALRRNTNSQNLDKVIDYYQKLYQVTDDSDVVLRQKMQVLKLNNHEEAYLAAFSAYFDSYVQKDKNLIESLDSRFNKMYDYGWIEFKNNFANECNVAAWFVVEQENKDNKKALTDAIKWSEISLMIEKDNYFYLDTLAQLYYLNGQKALAISTQEKALDFATRALGSETAAEFKIVLEKMKNNTY